MGPGFPLSLTTMHLLVSVSLTLSLSHPTDWHNRRTAGWTVGDPQSPGDTGREEEEKPQATNIPDTGL